MQGKDSPLRGFSQEDSYEIAKYDGTGWDSTKRVLAQICASSGDFKTALWIAEEWDSGNEPPWDVELEKHVRGLWNFVYPGEHITRLNSLPRLVRPEILEYALVEKIVEKYGHGAQKRINAASKAPPNAARALDFLFPENPWVAVAEYDVRDQRTARRESLRGMEERFAWLSPNPFGQKQVKVGKKWSMRCDVNVSQRRHLVIEFDLKESRGWGPAIKRWAAAGLTALDVHGALFIWIAATAGFRPFMIAYSGSVSYHAWYDVRAVTDDRIVELVQLALPLGGDPASLVPSQLFRMPGGTRLRKIDGKITRVRQHVAFWNPYTA